MDAAIRLNQLTICSGYDLLLRNKALQNDLAQYREICDNLGPYVKDLVYRGYLELLPCRYDDTVLFFQDLVYDLLPREICNLIYGYHRDTIVERLISAASIVDKQPKVINRLLQPPSATPLQLEIQKLRQWPHGLADKLLDNPNKHIVVADLNIEFHNIHAVMPLLFFETHPMTFPNMQVCSLTLHIQSVPTDHMREINTILSLARRNAKYLEYLEIVLCVNGINVQRIAW
jgi:hypothetical protein